MAYTYGLEEGAHWPLVTGYGDPSSPVGNWADYVGGIAGNACTPRERWMLDLFYTRYNTGTFVWDRDTGGYSCRIWVSYGSGPETIVYGTGNFYVGHPCYNDGYTSLGWASGWTGNAGGIGVAYTDASHHGLAYNRWEVYRSSAVHTMNSVWHIHFRLCPVNAPGAEINTIYDVPIDVGFRTVKIDGSAALTPPVISDVSPTPGNTIGANDALSFRCTDADGFRSFDVWVDIGSNWEKVYSFDLERFGPPYVAGSSLTVEQVGTQYLFSVRRTGGWPATPTLHVEPVDIYGAEG